MKGEYDPMRRMKQLLAAGLMMSVLATMSGGTLVSAATPKAIETNKIAKQQTAKIQLKK